MCTAVAGWGQSTRLIVNGVLCRGAQPAYIAVEDGSLRLGCVGAEPLSLVVDHAGIY